MNTRATTAVLLILLALVPWSASGQESDQTERIRIAILDLENKGGLLTEEIEQISELLRSRIAENAVLEVVERAQMRQVLEEQENQESGLFDSTNAPEYGRLLAVKHIMLGSGGMLFGKLVLSVRLIEVETALIVFTRTVTTDPENAYDAARQLATAINDAVVDLGLAVDLAVVEEALRRRDYVRAQELLDVYLSRHQVTPEVRSLRDEVRPGLYGAYLKRANQARRNDDFFQAREYVNLAIALRPTSDAYDLRERILRDETDYELDRAEEVRLHEIRVQRAEDRIAGLGQSPTEVFRGYYKSLDTVGHRLGIGSTWQTPGVPTLPGRFETGGIAYAGIFSLTKNPSRESIGAVPIALAAVHTAYANGADGATLGVNLFLAPHTGITFRLLNLFVTFALGGGASAYFSEALPGGYSAAATAGGNLMIDLRLMSSFGLYVAGELQRTVATGQHNGPYWLLSVSTGAVF